MEENHYYPFGLKHQKYTSGSSLGLKAIDEETARPSSMTSTPYAYKYQGQERQDELGLNWDSFKWRNYDYAIGRFMSIDPLAEKYSYQSPYNFAENRVVDGRELEGLEWVNADGNQVYDPKSGEYTSHATSNDKNLGNALKNSGQTGATQFNKLVNSDHPISVSYDLTSTAESKGGYELGTTGNHIEGKTVTADGKVVDVDISKSDIIINVEVASEYVSDIKSGKQAVQSSFDQTVKNNDASWFDVATATLGHEIEHTTSANQTEKANGGNVETKPTEIGEQILNDIVSPTQ